MIVVVIIGILAAVAIPSYQGFQDKAKSSEAKVSLSHIYSAEKAYFAEHENYTNDLEVAGVDELGKLKYYTVGFAASCVKVGTSVITATAADCTFSTTAAPVTPDAGPPPIFTAAAGRHTKAGTGTSATYALDTINKLHYTINQDRKLVGPK